MIRSLTTESTILPNAAPMITPTARSTDIAAQGKLLKFFHEAHNKKF
jgi:hypothetical protein